MTKKAYSRAPPSPCRKPDTPTFVTFTGSTDSTRLKYLLSGEAVSQIARQKADTFPSPPAARRSPDYGTQPRSFANTHYLPWDFPIVDLAQSLQAFLQEKAPVANSDLSLFVETRSGGTTARRPITNFAWATKVSLTIHRIPGADTADVGATGDTYVMAGASPADNELLEDLWLHTQRQTPVVAPTLRILFGAGGSTGKLTAGPPTTFTTAENESGNLWRASGGPDRRRAAIAESRGRNRHPPVQRHAQRTGQFHPAGLGKRHDWRRRLLSALPAGDGRRQADPAARGTLSRSADRLAGAADRISFLQRTHLPQLRDRARYGRQSERDAADGRKQSDRHGVHGQARAHRLLRAARRRIAGARPPERRRRSAQHSDG